MKILQVHNYYQQPGGEDRVVESEAALLRDAGHQVVQYTEHNDAIKKMGRLELASRTLWSLPACRNLKRLLGEHDFDVAHFHNTFPLISPAAYWTCKKAGVPVVQTLHNYRLGCPAAIFYRDGKICEECLGRTFAWPAIRHGCYQESRLHSAGAASMLAFHRMIGTWRRAVDLYIALTEFARDKMIAVGLPAEKIVVCRSPLNIDPGSRRPSDGGDYALFVGRLSQEKGVLLLIEAWEKIRGLPLKIVGDGPLLGKISSRIAPHADVELLGHQPTRKVIDLMKQARVLVVPSASFEVAPVTLLEARACRLPALVARGGSAQELVPEQYRFDPTATGLIEAVSRVPARDHPDRGTRTVTGPGLCGLYELARSQQQTRH